MSVTEKQPTTKTEYQTRNTCRSCESGFMWDILSLGDQALVGFDNTGKEPPRVPLTLCLCGDCRLVQLRHTTNPSLLYTENYGYRSGINEAMVRELKSVTNEVEKTVPLKPGDIVVDIGANDGTLLSGYKNIPGLRRVGFDPSRNMIDHFMTTMNQKGIKDYQLVSDYFGKWPFVRSFPHEKAKAVTAISMFYDLENPNKFLEDVKDILAPDGVFVIQQNYLVGMINQLAFDNICHEHLEYYSLSSLIPLLARHGFDVFDVEERSINGGSFRTYLRHTGASVTREGGGERVWATLECEMDMGLLDKEIYERFGKRVEANGSELKAFIEGEVENGKKVYVYGASTRGNTLLQKYGIDHKLVTGAAERNSDKIGKTYGSTGIPIVSEDEARSKADYFLALPWFLRDSFVQREREFLDRGGRFIFPLPKMEVVGR